MSSGIINSKGKSGMVLFFDERSRALHLCRQNLYKPLRLVGDVAVTQEAFEQLRLVDGKTILPESAARLGLRIITTSDLEWFKPRRS